MYVVVAGINSMSKRLVKKLEGNHDVVAVDADKDKCDRLYSSSGATVINKSPTTISALEDAGIEKADVLIAAEKEDNENMVVCTLAKKYGVPKVVTRVEDDEYVDAFQIIDAQPISHNDILLSEFLSTVEHPYLVKLANLKGDLELVKASVKESSELEDRTVDEIEKMKKFPQSFEITSVLRDEEKVEDVELRENDQLIMIGPEKDKEKLDSFFQSQ
ncbi:potassium channel family protein [Candidatus Nanosalina sp. VS9-1]|uniref:potassium channel family protein n=1 Tax=Candidatus Nanosalina sp. VS9-1 TaxID=3388566 RepID=UPI0039DFB747